MMDLPVAITGHVKNIPTTMVSVITVEGATMVVTMIEIGASTQNKGE